MRLITERPEDLPFALGENLRLFLHRRGEISGGALQALAAYVDSCIVDLGRHYGSPQTLAEVLKGFVSDVSGLQDGEALDMRPADFFYRLLALEPFSRFLKDENAARNLAIFSQLLNAFQSYYHYTVVTHRNRNFLRFHLFNSFLRLLHDGGINEYEDLDQPFPKGHVQVMTIHQAKGLEFPVVAVGSLSTQLPSTKQIDRDLGHFYHRPPFEPENRITLFDRMRLHYVAFSRAQKVLVLAAHETPKNHFSPSGRGSRNGPMYSRISSRPSASPCGSGCRSRRVTASPATSRSTRPARVSTNFFASTTSRPRARL